MRSAPDPRFDDDAGSTVRLRSLGGGARLSHHRAVAALVSISLAVACTPTPDGTGVSAPGADSSTDAPATGSTQGERGGQQLGRSADHLPIGTLEVSPSITTGGTTVTIAADRGPVGQVTAVAPDGTRLTAAGEGETATFEIPLLAPPGEWAVVATGDRPAIGTFQVATPGGLTLRADRAWLRSDGVAEITLDALDPPEGASVLFGWGDLDWREYLADATDDEPLGVLVPDDGGWLQPGADPVPLTDILGRRLLFSAVPAAGVQALVLSADGKGVETSNVVKLTSCDEAATINGSMAGPGWVHAVSITDRLRTAGIRVSTSSFALPAPAGTVALFGSLDDGSSVGPVVFEAPCGKSIAVDLNTGMSTGSPAATEQPEPGNGSARDEGTLTLAGDVERSFTVLPICQYRRQEVGIVFAGEDDDLPAISLMVPGGDASGAYPATLEITDWSKAGQQSYGAVEVTLSYRPGEAIPYADITVEGAYDGAAGSGTVSAAFGCSVLGVPPLASATSPTLATPAESQEATSSTITPFDPGGSGLPGTEMPCDTVVVDDRDHASGPATAAMLRDRVPRVDVVTVSELGTVVDILAPSDLAVLSRFAAAAQKRAPIIVGFAENGFTVEGREVGNGESTLVDAVATSGLCASGETTGSDPVEIVVEVADLVDRPLSGGMVTVSSPTSAEVASGPLVNGRFTSEVENGAAGYTVTVEAGLASATSFELAGPRAAQVLFGGYTIVLNPEDDVPVPPGPMGASIVGRNCRGPGTPWGAILVFELGPYLSMMDMVGAVSSPFAVLSAGDSPLRAIFGGFEGVFPQLAELPFAVEEARQIISSAPDAFQPILTGATFQMPQPGRSIALQINGAESDIRLTRSSTRPDLVRVTADGTWLFNARIEPRDTCPDELDVLALAPQLAPFR